MGRRERGFLQGLAVVTLLGGALRYFRLGEVPVALYCDEAFSAYEAWSLLLTGRDSRGVPFPLFFDIFGRGWGEPLHFYFSVPAVAVFGLTPFAARFAAATVGTLAIPLTGLMTRSLVKEQTGARAGILAAALMAVSPWSFHLNRIAFQANLLPFFLAAGFWLLSRALDTEGSLRASSLVLGASALGASLYTYTIARLMMPLLLAGFVVIHRHRLRGHGRAVVIAGSVLLVAIMPIAGFSATERGRHRFSDVAITNRPDLDGAGAPRMALAVAENYLTYYSPRFLLTEGDPNPRHSIRGHGVLHPHDLLALALGIAVCLRRRSRGHLFLAWWLLVYPVAASLTVDPRHAVRSICGQPGVYALAGLGVAALLRPHRRLPGRARRRVSAALLILMMVGSLLIVGDYLRGYFVAYPRYSGPAWQYGLQEAYAYVETLGPEHDSVYVTRNEDYPHAQFLFYRAFPPVEYQRHRLERTRYLFDQELFYRGTEIPNRLNPVFVLKPYEVDSRLVPRKVIRYPDGSVSLVIAW